MMDYYPGYCSTHHSYRSRNDNDLDPYRKRRRDEDEHDYHHHPHREHGNSNDYHSHYHGGGSGNNGHKRRRHSQASRGSSEHSKHRNNWDDEEHHYIIRLGESLIPRYKLISVMGEGTFGKVVECWDRDLKKFVAIKIVRAIEKYRDAAMIEIEVLETLNKHDPHDKQGCISLISWFDFRGHVCMVFEKFGLSLYDFLRKNHYRPFNLDDISKIGYQLLRSVAFMHSLTLIHTDLKPENVLFVNSDYHYADCSPVHNGTDSPVSRSSSRSSASAPFRVPKCKDIKLIDFGSATFDSHYHTTVVSTRHYRAPEVILGLGWTYPCDIWSIGCILVELYTGNALFQTHENREHMAMMEKAFGPIPRSMIDKADRHSHKYFRDGKVIFPQEDLDPKQQQKQRDHIFRVWPLSDLIKGDASGKFLDLLQRLLEYNPERRVTAQEALLHPFFDRIHLQLS